MRDIVRPKYQKDNKFDIFNLLPTQKMKSRTEIESIRVDTLRVDGSEFEMKTFLCQICFYFATNIFRKIRAGGIVEKLIF